VRRMKRVLPRDVARRTSGPSYPVSDGWREQIFAKMRELGISQAELARLAGISKSGLSDLLTNPKIRSSRLVPRVHKALGLPAPEPFGASDTDPVRSEIHALLDGLSSDELAVFLQFLKMRR